MASHSRYPALATVLVILLLAAIAVPLVQRVAKPPASSAGTGQPAPQTAQSPRPTPETADQPLARIHHDLTGINDPAEALRLLTELRIFLANLSPEEAARLITQFLATGDDATLPFSFQLGADGNLASHPTLRVALLDFLGQLAPEAAADHGREFLTTPTHADEWALALRNLARHDSDDREFLRLKTEELIRHPAWQADPSVGYFEAFDILVHTNSTESTPLLTSLIRTPDRNDLRHAAFLTLDRLTQRNPAAMLTRLASDHELNNNYPEMVAQQLARADLSDPEQAAVIKSWLEDPERPVEQQQAFQSIYPNRNTMVSRNLVSE